MLRDQFRKISPDAKIDNEGMRRSITSASVTIAANKIQPMRRKRAKIFPHATTASTTNVIASSVNGS